VVEVNGALKNKPESVNTDPHGSWLILIRLTKPAEVSALLDATQYADLVK
jgi:glycine cleavage system H protein